MVFTDLHDLCARSDRTEKHWDKLLGYLQQHPREAAEEEDEGKLPLHYALANRPPLPVVVALVQAYPEALFCRESMRGFFPLHTAVAASCDVEVVEYLFKINPQAAKMRSHRDFLCCIQEYVLLCRGKSLRGFTCLQIAESLPWEDPNQRCLVKIFENTQTNRVH